MDASLASRTGVPPATALATALTEFDVGIGGMTCASCVARVERAVQKVPGVASVSVNLATESARVRLQALPAPAEDAAHESQAQVLRAIRKAGYEPLLRDRDAEPTGGAPQDLRSSLPAALALALALPLMAPMVLVWFGVHLHLPAWVQFALATPVQFVLGARFYRAGWHALRAGSGNMDLLVAIGTSAAWALSVWLWSSGKATHGEHLYFESSAMVIALVLLGKWLEARAKRRTTSAIAALRALRNPLAHLRQARGETDVPVHELLVGDVVTVRAGEAFPADGQIVEGQTHADESLITGESLPVAKPTGAAVVAGSVNGEGVVAVKVRAVGRDSLLERIIRQVEDAQAAKAPVQALVDRVAAVFVPVVVVLALLTGAAWALWGLDLEASAMRAVAVLVIACPCALGLATPAAIMAGTGAAARHGILIRNAETLERAARIGVVAFDKTGTLTVGRPRLLEWGTLDPQGDPAPQAREALGVAASLQSASEHPLALAVRHAATEHGVAVRAVQDIEVTSGHGIAATLGGQRWALGNSSWFAGSAELGQALAQAQAVIDTEPRLRGATLSWLVQTGPQARVAAWFAFGDEPKVEAAPTMALLRQAGIRPVMISGDRLEAAQAIGERLGLSAAQGDIAAGVLPGQKAEQVQHLRQASGQAVAFVGDGVNDAPALAAADVGMAMGTGTDVAMNVADITLMRGDVALVPAALEIARLTGRKIRQNLFWAFFYNAAGIPLAALGLISPVLAGTAMALSSVSVMANALRLSRWRPPTGGSAPLRKEP